MNTPYFEFSFFTNLLILLVTARILGEIFERFKQPAMIGEILAGVILGPSLFNIVHRTEDIAVISELGIFLMVIIAGLEINIDDILKSLKGKNIITAILAFFLPIVGGVSIGYFFDQKIMTTLFIGLCISITALPVSIRILMDLGKINTETGQRIISIAIFEDVLALSILGVLLNIKDTDMSSVAIAQAVGISLLKLLLFVTLLGLAYFGIRKMLRKGNYIEESLNKLLSLLKGKEPLFALFFVFVLLFSTFTETLGLHFIVGAFFASLLISDKLIGKENLKTIEKTSSNISMGFLTPIFFATIGLEFNAQAINNIWLFVAIVVVSYLSKIAGGYFGGILAGQNRKVSLTIGIGINGRGIMELIIANIAYNNGLLSDEIFSILVIMGVLTTLTTPPLLKKAFEWSEA